MRVATVECESIAYVDYAITVMQPAATYFLNLCRPSDTSSSRQACLS